MIWKWTPDTSPMDNFYASKHENTSRPDVTTFQSSQKAIPF